MRSFFRSTTSGKKLEELVATLQDQAPTKGTHQVVNAPPLVSPLDIDNRGTGRQGRRKAKALRALEAPLTPASAIPPPTAPPMTNGSHTSQYSNGTSSNDGNGADYAPIAGMVEGDQTLIDPDLMDGDISGRKRKATTTTPGRNGSPIHNTRKRSPGSIASMKAKYMSPPDEEEMDEYSPPKQKRKPNRRDPVARQRQNRDAQQTYRDQKKSFADANADFVMEALVILSDIKRPSPQEKRLLELRDSYLPKAQTCWPSGFERFQERVEEIVRENKHQEQ